MDVLVIWHKKKILKKSAKKRAVKPARWIAKYGIRTHNFTNPEAKKG